MKDNGVTEMLAFVRKILKREIKMKTGLKRILAMAMAATMSLAAFTGCGSPQQQTSGAASGTASTQTTAKKEFNIVCLAGGDTNPSVKDWWIWKEYEKKTGIHINWTEIPESAMNDRKNVIMSSGELPDAFWQVTWTNDELNKYGSQGLFVNIQPYIQKDAPNLEKLLTQDVKGGLASITMPDKGVYSMPWVMTDLPQANARFYLNKNWLKAASLQTPTTIDDLTKTFAAFKKQNPSGWPIYMQPDGIGMLNEMLCGSYGIGNNGFKPISEDYYIDKSGKLQFLYTADGMKQMWQQMAAWWSAGYFYPQTFGKYEYEDWVTAGKVKKQVGMFGWGNADFLYSNASEDYVGISALKGPNGDMIQSWCDYPVRSASSFTITKACKDPETLIKWADYFYGDEGSKFAAYGKEGETYTLDSSNKIRYADSVLNYKGGAQLGAWQYGLFVYGGNFPWKSYDSATMETARKQDAADFKGEKFSSYTADSEKYKADLMPGLLPTTDEAGQTSAIKTDVDTYVKEARMKFVTGKWNFTSDWEAYVKQLQKMGINDYIKIKQTQYDRYKAQQ